LFPQSPRAPILPSSGNLIRELSVFSVNHPYNINV
jgi:hypothetical protein